MEAVWADWAIFNILVSKCIYKVYQIFFGFSEFLSRNCGDYFLGYFK